MMLDWKVYRDQVTAVKDISVANPDIVKAYAGCVVRWPNQPPTHGIEAHEQEALAFFKTFPDQHLVNNPYKTMIAQGDWTCTIAEFTGTMTGPMTMADGTVIAPTNKSFKVDFCTVAHWNEKGEIVEENLFYDLMGMLEQIGVM